MNNILSDRVEFQSRICEGNDEWVTAAQFLRIYELEAKSQKINIDDFLISFFQGENQKKIGSYKNKKLVSSVALLIVLSRINRRSVFWHQGTDILIPKKDQIQKLENYLNSVRKNLGEIQDAVFNSARALLDFCRGDYSVAEKLLSGSHVSDYPEGAISRGFFLGACTFGAGSYYRESDDRTSKVFQFDLNILGGRDWKDFDYLIISSCDQVYFDRFSAEYCRSARESGVNAPIIFMVYGSSFSGEIAKNIFVLGFQSDYDAEPALYASARYVLARNIILETGLSLFITDMDFCFSNDIFGEMESVAKRCDIGLTMHGYGVRSVAPWTAVSAPLAFFKNGKFALHFLENYESYFHDMWLSSKFRWWIDQNSLFNSYVQTRRAYPVCVFENIFNVANKAVTNGRDDVQRFKKGIR